MRIFSARVRNGTIVPEDGVTLREGMHVTVLVDNGGNTVEVSAEEEAELLEAIVGVEHGETVRADELLRRLRARGQ